MLRLATSLACALLTTTVVVGRQDVASAPADPPQASGERALQAIVMEVEGKARWRPTADAGWRDARVNDLLDPGAEVRTGLKSRLTMRVGRNATVLVDAGTTLELPRVAIEGDTLRTTALVRSGRVDFKVDKVGFANDFRVVTPQTTLSVRGTGFSLATGPLVGAEITGARTNMINAVEVRYVASNLSFFMSGGATSDSSRQDPVQNAWASTIGPPPVAGLIADKGQLEQQIAQGQAGNAPTNSQQAQQIAAAEANGLGGNGLIAAANQAGASDAIKGAASDVSGGRSSVPTPSDHLNSLKSRILRLELREARIDAPVYLELAADLSAEASTLTSASAALDELVGDPGFNMDIASAGSLAANIRAVEDFGELSLSELDRRYDLTLVRNIARVENWADRSIFTADPDGNVLDRRGGERHGVMGALLNARDWSAVDRSEATRLQELVTSPGSSDSERLASLVLLHDDPYRIWSLDVPEGGSPRPNHSPLLLALAMNERVQSAWSEVAKTALLELGSAHEGVDSAAASIIARLRTGEFGAVSVQWQQFIAEYQALADAEGTPASALAAEEVEALATAAGQAMSASLESALESLQQSADARTNGRRVLLQAAGVAMLERAADVASSCQDSVMGEGGIVENASDIRAAYQAALNHLVERGVALPSGVRVIGGNGP
jgi:hypothetical protein